MHRALDTEVQLVHGLRREVLLLAGVLAPWGILLSPAVGALLMSLSTVIVAIDAQFLRRVDLSLSRPPNVSTLRDPRPAD